LKAIGSAVDRHLFGSFRGRYGNIRRIAGDNGGWGTKRAAVEQLGRGGNRIVSDPEGHSLVLGLQGVVLGCPENTVLGDVETMNMPSARPCDR
jgi:hypothetical protein